VESVFLKNELIINALDLREVEVRFGYQNRGFRNVRLMQLVFEYVMSGDQGLKKEGTFRNFRNIPSQIAFWASQSAT